MASKYWCGKPCCECKHPCNAELHSICGLDCEHLTEDGKPDGIGCAGCENIQIWNELK